MQENICFYNNTLRLRVLFDLSWEVIEILNSKVMEKWNKKHIKIVVVRCIFCLSSMVKEVSFFWKLFKFCSEISQKLLIHTWGLWAFLLDFILVGMELGGGNPWISVSIFGSLCLKGLCPVGLHWGGPWRGQKVLSWSLGWWACWSMHSSQHWWSQTSPPHGHHVYKMPIMYPLRCVYLSSSSCFSPYYMCLCRTIWAGPWIKLTRRLEYLEWFCTHYRYPACRIGIDRWLPLPKNLVYSPLPGKFLTNIFFLYFSDEIP